MIAGNIAENLRRHPPRANFGNSHPLAVAIDAQLARQRVYNPLLALIFAAMMLGGYLWFRKTASSRERAPADPQLRIVS